MFREVPFIVLNASPQSDKIIVLTTTTTQYQKRQLAYGKDAGSILVGIHPEEYPEVERFCVIDCRACKAWEKNELLAVMRERGVEHKNPLPERVLRQIVANIARDRTIPSSIKNIIVDQGEQE